MKQIISTPNAPAAIGPYSQAVEANGTLYVSGQIPIDPSTGKLADGNVTVQTKQVFCNIKAILNAAGYTFDDVIKATVYLADMAHFADVNTVYKEYFQTDCPARAAFAVKGLPMNSLVEIEVIAAR